MANLKLLTEKELSDLIDALVYRRNNGLCNSQVRRNIEEARKEQAARMASIFG